MVVGAQVVLIVELARVAFVADCAVEEADCSGEGVVSLGEGVSRYIEVCNGIIEGLLEA